jgi:hypothetical protein
MLLRRVWLGNAGLAKLLPPSRRKRPLRNLLNVLASITERGAGFRSLKDVWADTTMPHGRLTRPKPIGPRFEISAARLNFETALECPKKVELESPPVRNVSGALAGFEYTRCSFTVKNAKRGARLGDGK